jgi:hypothetical protein
MNNTPMRTALEAVQAAMNAEAAALATFLDHRLLSNQAIWTAARLETDRAWSHLWELNRARLPATSTSGQEWARSMRVQASSSGSAAD